MRLQVKIGFRIQRQFRGETKLLKHRFALGAGQTHLFASETKRTGKSVQVSNAKKNSHILTVRRPDPRSLLFNLYRFEINPGDLSQEISVCC